jgi:hypothetical protein
VFAIVAAVALFITGATIVAWVAFRANQGPDHPDDWDPRVSDIVSFVERERGLDFEHPVQVDFLADEEFTADVQTSEADLTDEDRESIENAEAVLRALGLIEDDVDLFEQQNELVGEGTLAYYDPETETIRVRGTELTPDVRVTLAHELTHALQDQSFDLEAVEESVDEDVLLPYRTVVEGDATLVENAYRDEELTAADRDQHADAADEQVDEEALAKIPPVLIAFFQAPYALGPSFTSIVKEAEGTPGLNELIETPPESELQLLDPQAYFDDDLPEPVDMPPVPDGAEVVDDGEFGALSWYIVLASRVDPTRALAAVDGWAGDQYVSYADQGKVCVAARFRGSDDEAARTMRTMLDEWASSMPSGAATVTSIDGRTVAIESCDPGEASAPTADDVSTFLTVPAARLAIANEMMVEVDAVFDDAWCVANGVVEQLEVTDLSAAELSAEASQRVVGVMLGCGIRPR